MKIGLNAPNRLTWKVRRIRYCSSPSQEAICHKKIGGGICAPPCEVGLKSGISTKLTQLLTKPSPDVVPTISSSCAIAYKEILTDVQSSLQNEFQELSGNLILLYKANTARHCEDFEYFRREQQDIITTIQLHLAEAAWSAHKVSAKLPTKSLEMEKVEPPLLLAKLPTTLSLNETDSRCRCLLGRCQSSRADVKTRRIIARCSTKENGQL